MENTETKKSENKLDKIKNSEIVKKTSLIKALLIAHQGKELPRELKTKVMMTRIYYNGFYKKFEDAVKEATEGLKPEGFDKEKEEVSKLQEKIQKQCKDLSSLTEEMLKNILTDEEFDKHKAFMDMYNKHWRDVADFKSKKLNEEVEVEQKTFTQKEYEDLVNVNVADNYTIEQVLTDFQGMSITTEKQISTTDFLEMIYENFVC
jgi:hypothetical protein|nr:MAG TPA: hypothetical protein [Caudoviricetes sp.]